jgi:hypothetical protein
MAYGHAERNLAAIRLLETETREFLRDCSHSLSVEQAERLCEAAESAAVRLRSIDAPAGSMSQALSRVRNTA